MDDGQIELLLALPAGMLIRRNRLIADVRGISLLVC